jgi:hypothetical protein
MACHCGRGGKLAGQQRPGELVGDGQPADLLPRREPGLLDRVDLPDLVGGQGPDQRGPRPSRPSRPVDPGPLEGALEHARRRDPVRGERLEQFQADPAGAPARVVALEPAGRVADLRGRGGGRSPAAAVSDGQGPLAAVAVGAPEGPDGVVGEPQFEGDLGQRLAVEVALNDLEPGLQGEGTGHDRISWTPMGADRWVDPTHAGAFG